MSSTKCPAAVTRLYAAVVFDPRQEDASLGEENEVLLAFDVAQVFDPSVDVPHILHRLGIGGDVLVEAQIDALGLLQVARVERRGILRACFDDVAPLEQIDVAPDVVSDAARLRDPSRRQLPGREPLISVEHAIDLGLDRGGNGFAAVDSGQAAEVLAQLALDAVVGAFEPFEDLRDLLVIGREAGCPVECQDCDPVLRQQLFANEVDGPIHAL
jgi:hypothetical protein